MLKGDASLSKRPMKRVADPLGLMGAKIEGQGEKICAPLSITGGDLHPITYKLPVASAQVKSAVLLAGLFAPGKTSVVEPVPTRNHTERLMSHFGIKWLRDGDTVTVYGGQAPRPEDIVVPRRHLQRRFLDGRRCRHSWCADHAEECRPQ